MSLSFFFGPVEPNRSHSLPEAVNAGRCLPFTADTLHNADSWQAFATAVAPDREVDLLLLDLSYRSVPTWVWSSPLPIVVLAPDAQLQWHRLRRILPSCELVLADLPTCERLRLQGITEVLPSCLFGLETPWLEETDDTPAKDIDVLFLGNTHPAVQRTRLPWLGRLARLADSHRVLVADGIRGADYRKLLRRARIVFNRSVRGECNMRVFEAIAAGALLFQEHSNAELAHFLRDIHECVMSDNYNSRPRP